MGVEPLAWVNAVLYGVQLYVNSHYSAKIKPMSEDHTTPITPAPYAFAIWGFIYLLLTIFVIVDCGCSSFSIFYNAKHPNVLRMIFGASCIFNGGWIILFTSGFVNLATACIVLLWFQLLLLYAHVLAGRKDSGMSMKSVRLWCSELAITIYFAWTTAATLISFSVTGQDIAGGYLNVGVYIGSLAVLCVATITALTYATDIAFGLTAAWALIGIYRKPIDASVDAEDLLVKVHTCALVCASIILCYSVVVLLHHCMKRRSTKKTPSTARPLMSDKNQETIYYGS